MRWISAILLALGQFAAQAGGQTVPGERVAPISDLAEFDSLMEAWGLTPIDGETRLQSLDASTVLYLQERARFRAGGGGGDTGGDGTIYFVGGRQLIVDGEFSREQIAELLETYSCVCALDYESPVPPAMPPGELHTAAGVYRLDGPPTVSREASGVVRIEFVFLIDGQAKDVTLERLVCWNSNNDNVTPVAAALPYFATLTRKRNNALPDPPIDDRPVGNNAMARRAAESRWTAIDVRYFGFDNEKVPRLNAPEFYGDARPGIFTLLRNLHTGDSQTIDYSDYFEGPDMRLLDQDRRDGVQFRDPTYWP